MLEAEIIRKGDKLYESACETARNVYRRELHINLRSFPPVYISLVDDGRIVGGVGFLRGDETDKLTAEKLCEIESFDLAPVYEEQGVESRSQVGEVCSLHAEEQYRRYVPILFSLILRYLHETEVRAAMLTQALSLRKTFKQMGIPVRILCFPEFERCRHVLENPDEWAEVYFRLKPACSVVPIKEGHISHQQKKTSDPMLMPPFNLGIELSRILN